MGYYEDMKKVLIFSLNYYPRFIGGAEVAIKEITDRLSPEEFEFHMVALRIDSNLAKTKKVGNVIVHRIGFTGHNPGIADLKKFPLHLNKYYYQIGAYFEAIKLQKKEKFDATWAMMAHSCGIPAGLFKKKFPEVKYLLTLQEGDPPEYIEGIMKKMPFVWALFKRGFTSADALQPISTFLQKWGEHMGFAKKSEVIPNAVNVAKFSHEYSTEELTAMKEKLGKKSGDVFMVTTSRLVHKNGIDDVIKALTLLPENVSFLIYGIGPDEDMLRKLAKDSGVETRARFMGQISHEEMPLMLKACDIFTRPSRSEGMGNSFIEAMAARLPVIATQEGGIADFLFDDSRPDNFPEGAKMTGWAVDADSPEQIAAAVKDILARPEKVAEVTRTASAMVIEKYDWDKISAEMHALFVDLTAKK
jgi:glycosyltransferase involved in cell wall biosynthesis